MVASRVQWYLCCSFFLDMACDWRQGKGFSQWMMYLEMWLNGNEMSTSKIIDHLFLKCEQHLLYTLVDALKNVCLNTCRGISILSRCFITFSLSRSIIDFDMSMMIRFKVTLILFRLIWCNFLWKDYRLWWIQRYQWKFYLFSVIFNQVGKWQGKRQRK